MQNETETRNTTTVAAAIATAIDARQRCLTGPYSARVMEGDRDVTTAHFVEWARKHAERAEQLTREYLPSGSGIDRTTLDLERSTADHLVFHASFHHMDEFGGYDGWTDHTIRVRASLVFGLSVAISGRDRNGIKDHLHDVFDEALSQVIAYPHGEAK